MRSAALTYGAPPRVRVAPAWGRQTLEAVLTRFATELSPARGTEFFESLVVFVADCLGFDVAVVGE